MIMLPEINELDTPIVNDITNDLEGFENQSESDNLSTGKLKHNQKRQWLLDKIVDTFKRNFENKNY
jgi:hypothetical protein